MKKANDRTRVTRANSMFRPEALEKIVLQPDETPQQVETTASSSTMTSIRDPRVLDALNRLVKSEAWLEDHNEEHPQWLLALARQMSIIGELTELELQGAEIPW